MLGKLVLAMEGRRFFLKVPWTTSTFIIVYNFKHKLSTIFIHTNHHNFVNLRADLRIVDLTFKFYAIGLSCLYGIPPLVYGSNVRCNIAVRTLIQPKSVVSYINTIDRAIQV